MAPNYQIRKSELISPNPINTKKGAFWKQFPGRALEHFQVVRQQIKAFGSWPCGSFSTMNGLERLLHTARGPMTFQGQREEKQSSPVTASMEERRKLPSLASAPMILCSLLPPPRGTPACTCVTPKHCSKCGCRLVSACSSHQGQR